MLRINSHVFSIPIDLCKIHKSFFDIIHKYVDSYSITVADRRAYVICRHSSFLDLDSFYEKIGGYLDTLEDGEHDVLAPSGDVVKVEKKPTNEGTVVYVVKKDGDITAYSEDSTDPTFLDLKNNGMEIS